MCFQFKIVLSIRRSPHDRNVDFIVYLVSFDPNHKQNEIKFHWIWFYRRWKLHFLLSFSTFVVSSFKIIRVLITLPHNTNYKSFGVFMFKSQCNSKWNEILLDFVFHTARDWDFLHSIEIVLFNLGWFQQISKSIYRK